MTCPEGKLVSRLLYAKPTNSAAGRGRATNSLNTLLSIAPPPALSANPNASLRRRHAKNASAVATVMACGAHPLPKTEAHSIKAAHAVELTDWIARASLKSHAK